jgi:uncharacterized protein (DUF952 family)
VRLLHVTTREAWEGARATGLYEGDSLEAEGFIHCCTEDQLEGVVERFFAGGGPGLVILFIDPERVTSEIRWEDGFPHVYGPLEIEAVTSAAPLLSGSV